MPDFWMAAGRTCACAPGHRGTGLSRARFARYLFVSAANRVADLWSIALEPPLGPAHPGTGAQEVHGRRSIMRTRMRSWLAATGLWAVTALALLGVAGHKWQ
jgi:hypothetical protein